MYEMVTMSHPFSGVEGHSLIWQVGNGRCPSLERVQEGRLKDVVRGCWQAEAVKRPSFEDLLWTIEQNVSVQMGKVDAVTAQNWLSFVVACNLKMLHHKLCLSPFSSSVFLAPLVTCLVHEHASS